MIAFFKEESGAVTVDWVVLTGALVGVGLAVASVVAVGVGNAANATADQMAGMTIDSSVYRYGRSMGFENGLGEWIGGVLGYSDEYGNVLRGGEGSGQVAQHTFDVTPNSEEAVISFDMHAIDSWDGESFDIYVDNEHVASASFSQHVDGASGSWVSDNPDFSFALEQTSARENVGFNNGYEDQSFRMQVTMANPGDDVTVGFGSTLDQGINDESWAVDNISVTSR